MTHARVFSTHILIFTFYTGDVKTKVCELNVRKYPQTESHFHYSNGF